MTAPTPSPVTSFPFSKRAIEAAARAMMNVRAFRPGDITRACYESLVLSSDPDFDDLPTDGSEGTSDDEITQEAVLKLAEAALTAALDGMVVQGWRMIDSAPKDGTEVWAFNGEQARMKWLDGSGHDDDYSLWVWADELSSDADPSPEQPTHWQPLPTPPAAQGE